MPAAITHFLHAQRVLEHLQKTETNLEWNPEAFFWGAQGPDFLYCHRYFPWQKGENLRTYAEKLHRTNPSKILSLMRECYRKQSNKEMTLSYIDGFLCHYSLDRICHPFVQSGVLALLAQDATQGEEILHNQIESALDVILLRYEKSALPTEFDLKQTVPKDCSVQLHIADLYAYLLHGLFGVEDAGLLLYQATKDCRKVFGLLNDRTTLKQALLERRERNGKRTISCHFRGISEGDDCDYANILHQEWNWPADSGTARDDSFLDLYEESVKDSIQLIGGFLQTDDYDQLTDNIFFI
ncbi:zinc dependent phospholipase C family protein [Caproiciproducens faecalis]|uniref:Zinc dependent phospholipase C family protein n=1 Tax=Caproiciproducens faecalis TaxID=2820301 RepID=A0ABS7DQA6_9FIRM|nr:zinc dependent phospholipase C family protein [Caproiciproducens faecalis]MBW7573487.1 zinc dependent phospholipase C family protein [Caproiciproducens faecalis]